MKVPAILLIVPFAAAVSAVLTAGEPAVSPEGIPLHQEALIRKAAPERPRAAPRKERRVLSWSTPPHLMDKDPHKGYCVPYGLCAMRVLGEKSGAYRPVVSDDLASFLPENIRGFDAIVMNNSCGPWITPDDAVLARMEGAGATREPRLPAPPAGGGPVRDRRPAGGGNAPSII
jgi:hypothetical protein